MPLLTENVEITSTRLKYQASCEVRYLEREAMVGDNNVVGKELHAGWDEMGRFVWCVLQPQQQDDEAREGGS